MIAIDRTSLILRARCFAADYKITSWLLPVVVFLVAWLMQRSVALLGLDLHHDSFMFDAAKRLIDGEKPFRDFFYQYNLGTIFFHALALKTFGIYISSLKIATSYVYALIAVLIYAGSAILKRPWYGFCAALAWSTLSPFHMPVLNGYHAWSTVYMMASVMAGAILLLMADQKRVLLYSVLAGMCFSLAFWFKQIAGLQILFVIFWILLNTRCSVVGDDIARCYRTICFGFVVGGLLAATPFFYYIVINKLSYDWWRSAFVFNKFFALTGASSAGIKALLQTFVPVQRDLGYTSYIWAVLPLYLVVEVLGTQKQGRLLPFRNDEWSRRVTLLIILGLAGWIEYFPLPHSFHTQLFLAPVFCLAAVTLFDKQNEHGSRAWRRLINLFWVVFLLIVVYEVYVHLNGLRVKTLQTRVVLEADTPVKGLRILPQYIDSLNNFYSTVDESLKGNTGISVIPLSADPIRAIFPSSHQMKDIFKMGVDWTWPNELVEPGFNQRLTKLIHERRLPIYGDSVLGIPGYVPVSLLEMSSPLGEFHTFYLPSADSNIEKPQVFPVSKVFVLGGTASKQLESDKFNGLKMECGSPIFHAEVLIQFEQLPEVVLSKMAQLHVSVISDSEFSQKLTELEYRKFMIPALAEFGEKTSADHFYLKESSGQYGLRPELKEADWIYLSKFFLYRGKFHNQRFSTTLAQSEKNQPFIVTDTKANVCPKIVWSKSRPYMGQLAKDSEFFLAMPAGLFIDGGPMTMYVQMVMEDRTTHNVYLRYGFEGSGMAGE